MNNDPNNQEPRLLSAEDPASHVDPFEESFERHRLEFAALEADEVLTIRLDLPPSIATALGVAKEIEPFREQLAHLSGFDIRNFDELRSYAQALSFANTLFLIASEPLEDIKPLYDRAIALRHTLNLDVRALVNRGLLEGKQLEKLAGDVGHKNVATDLQILGLLLRTHWADVEGKAGTTRAEIEEAVTLAYKVLVAIGEKEQADANINRAADMRARAYTVFLRVYDEVRRAVTFLRWQEDDVDQYVPTLWMGRGRKKAASTEIPPKPANGSAPASSAATPDATAPAAAPNLNIPGNQSPYVTN